jgi:NDP-sugar pyrophosphorylase family protein
MTQRAHVLIMAGGRSERMRKRGDPTHKALVCLNGTTLVEHCLARVLSYGFGSITISISAAEHDLIEFARTRLQYEAARAGARLECLIEDEPLGTIGAAGCLHLQTDPVLVVNADNVTDIDLKLLLRKHRTSAAAMTIATHCEHITMPFGEVVIEDDIVRDYAEKPIYDRTISSGVYVLSAVAVAHIGGNERINIPELYARLNSNGFTVCAYQHQAAWIDVNDAHDLARAESLMFSSAAAARRPGVAL